MDQETLAITRLKRGDIRGLAALVRLHQHRALRTAYLITQDEGLAEDVTQAAFLRAYEFIHTFDIHRAFAPWFLRLVANLAVQAAKQPVITAIDSPTIDDLLADSTFQPETEVEMRELEAMVQQALLQLSPEQRAVIVLKYYADYSEQEMSAALNTPPGTIKSRLNTARGRLRGLLKLMYNEG